jgi:hypothetical protein
VNLCDIKKKKKKKECSVNNKSILHINSLRLFVCDGPQTADRARPGTLERGKFNSLHRITKTQQRQGCIVAAVAAPGAPSSCSDTGFHPPGLIHPVHSPVSSTQSTPRSHPPGPLPSLIHPVHSPVSSTRSTPRSHPPDPLPGLIHPVHSPVSSTRSTPQSHPPGPLPGLIHPIHSPVSSTRSTPRSHPPDPLPSLIHPVHSPVSSTRSTDPCLSCRAY